MNWIDRRLGNQRLNVRGVRTSNRFARTEPEINLIAFIDVLLVVLIFLMVSTTFTRYSALAITLPTATGSDAPSASSITIAVSRDGRYAINGKVVDRAQLSTSLATLAGQNTRASSLEHSPQINIDADARASHQAVMGALEAARDANLPNVVFSSQGKK